MGPLTDAKCHCHDCEAAVSPLAYLADLLDYALDHLDKGGGAFTLEELSALFHQQFEHLPVSCDEMNRQVRQIRICIEVLRRYKEANKLGPDEASLTPYRTQAYLTLLNKLGISYEDLRLARLNESGERQALASRLGIELTPKAAAEPRRHDELDQLYLDPEQPVNDDETITEAILEELFGLVATIDLDPDQPNHRDPTSSGLTLGDDDNLVARWMLHELRWGLDTDRNGVVHVSVEPHAGGPGCTVSLYRDSARTDADKIATGELADAEGPLRIVDPHELRDLGVIELNEVAASTSIRLVVFPRLLSWRLRHLRTLWATQDRPPNLYSEINLPPDKSIADLLPIIDPDIVGPDDFRHPYPKPNVAAANGPFDLWAKRRDWVDAQLEELFQRQVLVWDRSKQKTCRAPDFNRLFTRMAEEVTYEGENKTPWKVTGLPADVTRWAGTIEEALNSLLTALTRAPLNEEERVSAESARKRLTEDFHLDPDRLKRLMFFHQKSRRSEQITIDEWHEVVSILLQCQKSVFFEKWRQEEAANDVLLGMEQFWAALRLRREGAWPPRPSQLILDPEEIEQDQAAELFPGKTGLRLWEARKAELELIRVKLSGKLAEGVEACLEEALGPVAAPFDGWSERIAQVAGDLTGTPNRQEAARTVIDDTFRMPEQAFVDLTAIVAKPPAAITPLEKTAFINFLAGSSKLRVLHPRWRLEQDELPVIDPEAVKLEELPEPTAGRRAIALWRERRVSLEKRLKPLTKLAGSSVFGVAEFDQLILTALPPVGPNPLSVDQLHVELNSGDARRKVEAQLAIATQWCLTQQDFNDVFTIHEKLNRRPIQQPTEAELSQVIVNLVTAQKCRELFRDWRTQEDEMGLHYSEMQAMRLPKWRASATDRAQWLRALTDRSALPLIDPDLNEAGDFVNAGSTPVARKVWEFRVEDTEARLAQLAALKVAGQAALANLDRIILAGIFDAPAITAIKNQIRADWVARSASDVAVQVLGKEFTALTRLHEDLGDAAKEAEAVRIISNSLGTSPEQFVRLMQVITAPVPSAADIEEAQGILAEAVLLQSFVRLDGDNQMGHDISRRLEQFGIDLDAFIHLARLRRVAVDASLDDDLLQGEWDGILDIFVQCWKGRQFAAWRDEEAQKVISLGPDHSQFPTPLPLQFPPPPRRTLRKWRAWRAERLDWEDRLQARLDHYQSVIDAFNQAADAAEELVLPELRNRLLAGIPQGTNNDARAQWVTDNLLIDAKQGACQKTTRVAQALTTVQGLLFTIRNGLLESHPKIQLRDAENFDEEMSFIGSLATWRAAQFVFTYPENVAIPALRRVQSPAFRKLVKDLRGSRALTPERACAAAAEYASYFEDVCKLQVEASCVAETMLHKGETCSDKKFSYLSPLLYVFGRGGKTGRVYWCTPTQVRTKFTSTDPLFSRNFWTELEPLKGVRVSQVVGAVSYRHLLGEFEVLPGKVERIEERFLYLFVKKVEKGREKLAFARYDLGKEKWDAELMNIELPKEEPREEAKEIVHFQVVLKQQIQDANPPHLVLQLESGALYEGVFSKSGNELEAGTGTNNGWRRLVGRLVSKDIKQLCSMVETSEGEHFLIVRKSSGLEYRLLGRRDDGSWRPIVGTSAGTQFQGAFCGDKDNDDALYVVWGDGKTKSQHVAIRAEQMRAGEVSDMSAWFRERCGVKLEQLPALVDEKYEGTPLRDILKGPASEDFRNEISKGLKSSDEEWSEWRAAVKLFNACGFDFDLYLILLCPTPLTLLERTTPEVALAPGPSPLIRLRHIAPSSCHRRNAQRIVIQMTGLKSGPHLINILGIPAFGFPLSPSLTTPLTPQVRLGLSKVVPLGNKFKVEDLFVITSKLTSSQIQDLGMSTGEVYGFNQGALATNLVLLDEVFYFIRVHLALQLQRSGQYTAALDWLRTAYDYHAPYESRKIATLLKQEESLDWSFEHVADWLLDPLNPHAIAETRKDTYTRFTLLSIVRCFLEFAHSEYTIDSPESVPRARELYSEALELLESPELNQKHGDCDELIGKYFSEVQGNFFKLPPTLNTDLLDFLKGLRQFPTFVGIEKAFLKAKDILSVAGNPKDRLLRAKNILGQELSRQPVPARFGNALEGRRGLQFQTHTSLLADERVSGMAVAAGLAAGNDYQQAVSAVANVPLERVNAPGVDVSWLRNEYVSQTVTEGAGKATNRVSMRIDSNLSSVETIRNIHTYVPRPHYAFCVPPNPVIRSLRLQAELNLYKIRTCRNITGMFRQLDLYAAPTDTFSGMPVIGAGGQLVLPGLTRFQPTPYRFAALIERAKHLATLAQQVEAVYLSALEKRDAESYSMLKARQDLRLARAGVKLQDLRVMEAEDGVQLAELQEERAEKQVEHYGNMLSDSKIEYLEIGSMISLGLAASAQGLAGGLMKADNFAQALATEAGAMQMTASLLSQVASHEIRRREWEFQKQMGEQDVKIAAQQTTIAQDHVRIVVQERDIASMQSEHAEAVADFLSTKFTNVELYEWMSDVLQDVYGYFLQQAITTARLASAQLGFERQQTPPTFIQADYWEPNEDSFGAGDEKSPDRRGLTGSARLLRDIYQLDQYAFDTNKRGLQPPKTISLAQFAPAEFQRFRETGVLRFGTSLEMLDREFPGHYLRLIKRIKTSVIALIPPNQNIHASLASLGTSRVVVEADGLFQKIVVRRPPEEVAFTSTREATGLIADLEAHPEMLAPFEGLAFETQFEFRMARAANRIDYSTIADVIVTIEYAALNSFDYRQQLVESMRPNLSLSRPFSFRHQLADQWFDLNNSRSKETTMSVRFQTRRENFAPNLSNLKIQHVTMYFSRGDGKTFEVPVSQLRFSETGGGGSIGGAAVSIEGLISTRNGNGGGWSGLIGRTPFGEWELSLPNTEQLRNWLKKKEIEDILFVITYSGRTPEWPA